MVKRLPTMQETWVQSLGREDPLEKEMATHSSTLAWKIPRTEECGRLQSMGLQRIRHDWVTSLHQEVQQIKTAIFPSWLLARLLAMLLPRLEHRVNNLVRSLAMLGFLGHVSFRNMGKLLFFPFQDEEINHTSNIYPPYLAYSSKALGCGFISNEMPNI